MLFCEHDHRVAELDFGVADAAAGFREAHHFFGVEYPLVKIDRGLGVAHDQVREELLHRCVSRKMRPRSYFRCIRLFRRSRLQQLGEQAIPRLVAFVVHVQAVVAEEFSLRLAVGAEERRGGVDVGERALFLLRKLFDAGVDFLHLRPHFPAGDAGFDREVNEWRVGQVARARLGEKCFEVAEDAVGRAAGGDVVVAGIEDDQPSACI